MVCQWHACDIHSLFKACLLLSVAEGAVTRIRLSMPIDVKQSGCCVSKIFIQYATNTCKIMQLNVSAIKADWTYWVESKHMNRNSIEILQCPRYANRKKTQMREKKKTPSKRIAHFYYKKMMATVSKVRQCVDCSTRHVFYSIKMKRQR